MGDGVGVADINGAVGGDGAEESADYSVGLVLPPHVAVADAVDDDRMDPRRHARAPLQNSVIDRRHCRLQIEEKKAAFFFNWDARERERMEDEGFLSYDGTELGLLQWPSSSLSLLLLSLQITDLS